MAYKFKQIISGGQTGADQAGLYAAKICGIKTGGFATRTFKTLMGLEPILLRDIFKLEPISTNSYKDRTWTNVAYAHCTLRFFTDEWSPGEKCTLNAIVDCEKSYLDIDLNIWNNVEAYQKLIEYFEKWEHGDLIINIAGNAETTSPGICAKVVQILIPVFEYFKNKPEAYI